MEGVRGAYFVYPFKPGLIDAASFFAQAAIEAGVESIVNMSQKSARREAKSEAARDHWITEQIFDWSGVPTADIRPTFFAEWLFYPMDGWNVKGGVIEFPFADGRHAPIAGEDQVRVTLLHCCRTRSILQVKYTPCTVRSNSITTKSRRN